MNETRTFEQVYKLITVKDKKYVLWDMMMHNLVARNNTASILQKEAVSFSVLLVPI
jgi:hypothetical protein